VSYEDFESIPPMAADASRFPVGNSSSETSWSPPRYHEYHLGMPSYTAPVTWDRNFNGRVDTGRIPAPVRLRAKTVTRFNYYDKRLIATY